VPCTEAFTSAPPALYSVAWKRVRLLASAAHAASLNRSSVKPRSLNGLLIERCA